MQKCSVCILFRPRLYAELLARLLDSMGDITLVNCNPRFLCTHPGCSHPVVQVYLLSLDENNNPELSFLPNRMRQAKVIAFSPSGQLGLLRRAGQTEWETIRPFPLKSLIEEIQTTCDVGPIEIPVVIEGITS